MEDIKSLTKKQKKLTKKIKSLERRVKVLNFFNEEHNLTYFRGETFFGIGLAGLIFLGCFVGALFAKTLIATILASVGVVTLATGVAIHFTADLIEGKLDSKKTDKEEELEEVNEKLLYLKEGIVPKTKEEKELEQFNQKRYRILSNEIKKETERRLRVSNLIREMAERNSLEERAGKTIEEMAKTDPELAEELQRELDRMQSI